MTYTEKKERSHRFVLALRMGLPIFLMSVIALYALFSQPYSTLTSLIILAVLLFTMAVYFLFFLINQSSYEHITESITYTFTPEYFFKLFYSFAKRKTVTIVMISIDNLLGINERYGVKNGDEVLKNATMQINEFFTSKEIKTLPLCRFKGGDFILLLLGEKEANTALVELFLAKHQETLINEIEVKLSAVLLDTKLIKQPKEIITRLYELQYANKEKNTFTDRDDIIPHELEEAVLEALTSKRYSVALQTVYCDNTSMNETTFKLVNEKGGLIHQSRFIPLLNRIGKMREHESNILEKVVGLASEYKMLYVVNISSVTLRNGLFFQHALELLQRYPDAKNNVIIMMDEKEYCSQIKRFKELIAQYRAVGYKIALDKYGMNHTTMMYLKELDVDYVRFDSLYARHIKEEKYQNIVQGLNITAHLCGAATWMNMIEDEESDKVIQGLKINCRQGNFHGKITVKEEQ
ncbi:MAG: EAL domain-containing protein [Sulfuricurvum sp.]|nr:EAL domain-containing protein [Sulfuricurvum sp.]